VQSVPNKEENKQNRTRNLVVSVVIVCSIGAMTLGWLTVKIWTTPLPKPISIQIALPETEILPAEQVHPGAFRIEKTVSEIVRLARANPGGKPLVSFSSGWDDKNGVVPVTIEYWTARGDIHFVAIERFCI